MWNHNDGRGAEHVNSAGGGVRADLDGRLALDAALAFPLERAGLQTSRGDPRLLVTLTSRIHPVEVIMTKLHSQPCDALLDAGDRHRLAGRRESGGGAGAARHGDELVGRGNDHQRRSP